MVFSSISFLHLALTLLTAPVEIAATDRPDFQAELESISETSVRVAADSETLEIPLEKLRSVRFTGVQPASPAAGAKRVTLADGSVFSCSQLTCSAETVRFSLFENTVELPTEHVLHIQLQDLKGPLETQWAAISQSRLSGDALVLIRSTEALEKLEGIIVAVGPESVSFDFGGQVIDAPLTKLAGLCFFSNRQKQESATPLSAVVSDQVGNRWMAHRVQAPVGPDSQPRATLSLVCGPDVELPLDRLREIDFSFGSMQFLADLDPILSESTKQIDLLANISGVKKLFAPRRMEPVPLSSQVLGPSLKFLGSGSTTYRVPPGFTRLVGAIELRPVGNHFTPCSVSILLENKVIWQQQLSEAGSLESIDLGITPDARVKLEVVANSATPVGDTVIWHELRFVK
jgi:hypothetical protein